MFSEDGILAAGAGLDTRGVAGVAAAVAGLDTRGVAGVAEAVAGLDPRGVAGVAAAGASLDTRGVAGLWPFPRPLPPPAPLFPFKGRFLICCSSSGLWLASGPVTWTLRVSSETATGLGKLGGT